MMNPFGNKFALATAVLSIDFAAAQTPAPTPNPTAPPTPLPTPVPTSPPTAYLGTGQWYADTANGGLCAKDCVVSSSDPDCSGVNHDTASWLTDTFATAAACCAAKFSYLDSDYCADRSSSSPSGTNKYYADISTNSCLLDDSVGSMVFAAGTLYDTAAACCAGSLGWILSDYCTTRSEGGAGYINEWYVDYTSMVCKKDCAVSSADPECEPISDSSASNTLFTDAAACCAGKLGWIDATACEAASTGGAAAAATGTDKYYADYTASPGRCAKDCDTVNDPTCGGILTNVAGVQMFDTVASCCSAKFGYMDADFCASLTTGTSTQKWYVKYDTNTCKQDCQVSGSSDTCAGTPPDTSMALFDTLAECCAEKLPYVATATCTDPTASTTGTLKFYADYTAGACVKDCPAAVTSPECGGVVANSAGVQFFDTASECCSAKYGWIDADLCVALGSGTYINKFYVDYADKSCRQDCASGTNNCAGHPSDLSIQLFDTAADCCANKLSYVNQEACESKSTTGTESAATGSSKWYVDWSISKCAKDCAVGSDAECGGLAENWELADYDSWSACCDAKLSWVRDADCHLG